jgi:hypothetical protein
MPGSEKSDFSTMAIDGVAAYAKFNALIGVFITFIIFCCTSYIGYYYFYNKEDIYDNNFTKGTVKDSTCTKYRNNTKNSNDISWDCSMNLLYNINNNEYVQNYHTNSSTYYSPGSNIDLRYNKYNNNDITTDTYSNHFKGSVIMFIGFFLLLLSLIYTYSVFTWKIVAVTSGASTLAGNFASSINKGLNS